MKFLVADDEPLVRAELAYLLTRVCAGCAVDEATSGSAALASLSRDRYDALFFEHVVEVSTLFAGAYLLRLDDKARSEIPVSRNFVPAVRSSLRL